MGRKQYNKRKQKQHQTNKKSKNESFDLDSLDIETKEKYQEFINTTVHKDTFTIENVAEDGACFFRSISNGLFHIVDCDGDTGGDVLCNIGQWKSNDQINGQNTVNNKYWGYKGSEQTYLATKIQQMARQWLIKNYDKSVDHVPGYRVVDLVRDSHGFDLDDDTAVMAFYDICYSKFAGAKRKLKRKVIEVSEDEMLEPDMDINTEGFEDCMIEDKEETETKTNPVNEETKDINMEEIEDMKELMEDYNIEPEMDEYDPELYGDYTGYDDSDDEEEDEDESATNEDDEFIKDATSEEHNKIKEALMKKYDIDISDLWDKWGSNAECYALSKYLKIPIIIYAPKRFNFKNGRIENGRLYKDVKPDKNVRFQELQVWGAEYRNDDTPPIELLYRKLKGNIEHYMVMYRN